LVLVILAALLIAALFLGYRYYNLESASQITSVAVLPFENGSGDPNLDYLSDGLSETLIDKLSQLPQLKVIARNSSFKYRGPNLDLKEVADKLGARAIVTGKVVRVGDDLNVHVEMVDAENNQQLWSEQFNRKESDLIAVQQEIAETASDKLRLKLSGTQQQQLAKHDTQDPHAYELMIQGRYMNSRGGIDNRLKGIELLEQAVIADPRFAFAYAELSVAYNGLASASAADPKIFIPKAEAAARKALELDENLANGHLAMSTIHVDRWEWDAAEAEIKKAIELDPNNAQAYELYGRLLTDLGRHDEAIAQARHSRELDPLSSRIGFNLGYRLHLARRYDEAIAEEKNVIAMDPGMTYGYVAMGYALWGKGQYKDAIEAYQDAIRVGDTSTSTQVYLGSAYAYAGDREKAQAILNKLRSSIESPAELAILYAALGDKEAAFASLEKGYEEHDLQMQFLKVDPEYDPLRSDPRFDGLLKKVGLA
jgi:TolB-like protein/Flp pilus assembly protein TadD